MPNKKLLALFEAKQKRLEAQKKAIEEEENKQKRAYARNQILR